MLIKYASIDFEIKKSGCIYVLIIIDRHIFLRVKMSKTHKVQSSSGLKEK